MAKKRGSKQTESGGKEKMVTTSFRLPESTLQRLKEKLGPFAMPTRFYRILVEMYLDGKIKVTQADIEKYGKK